MRSLLSKAEATKYVNRPAPPPPDPGERRTPPRTWRAGVSLALGLAILAGCTSSPRYRTVPRPEPSVIDAPLPGLLGANRSEIVATAQSYVGTPYRSGGSTRSGVDCSGLVMAVFRESNIRLPRTSLDQSQVGVAVGPSDLLPGDLVFFRTSPGGDRVSHVGIFIGGGRFIHASTSARRVRIDELDDRYFRRRFVTAQRVIED